MSVEVTRLPSGLTVVTDAMPHLETASLGVWVGAGSRDEDEEPFRYAAKIFRLAVAVHMALIRRARGDRQHSQRHDRAYQVDERLDRI